jgi:hypothetical protein
MVDEQPEKDSESVLVGAAKAIGSVVGKVASLAGASDKPVAAKPEYKEGTYKATYLGSGTFIISKPKRKKAKLQQSRLKGTVRGARK